MREYQRKQLLERLDREGATIGGRIPERLTVQGEEIALRDFVFETKRHDTVPAEHREKVQGAIKNLRRERLERRQIIERSDEVTFEEAEDLVESIIGINRAITALSNLEPTDLEHEAAAQHAADRQRWMSFLRQVLGSDARTNRQRE